MSGNGFFKIQAVGKKVKTVQVTNSQEENLQKKKCKYKSLYHTHTLFFAIESEKS